MANIMRWYSPADVMDRAGAMWALIGRCRFGRPTGGGGIEGSNPHEPVSSDQYGRHRCHPRGWQGLSGRWNVATNIVIAWIIT
jgi:hypothetical protein